MVEGCLGVCNLSLTGIHHLPQVAAALAARHIGGAVNYVGVSETLNIGSSAQLAGLAADNLICAVYFTAVFQLARNIGPDAPAQTEAANDSNADEQSMECQTGMQVRQISWLVCNSHWRAAEYLATQPNRTGMTV